MEYRIFFRSTDEVNRSLAEPWCEGLGLDCRLVDPRDPLFPVDADAVVLDLDHLGLGPRDLADFVRRLTLLRLPYPVAVVSYRLESDAVGLLIACGVLVFERLDEALFRDLASALERRHSEVAA